MFATNTSAISTIVEGILFFSMIYSTPYLNSSTQILTFLNSLSGCRITSFIIFSDVDMILAEKKMLPGNVKLVVESWPSLISRSQSYLNLPNNGVYSLMYSNIDTALKVADFKPMIPILYPELFSSHRWFGWVNKSLPVYLWLSNFINEKYTASL